MDGLKKIAAYFLLIPVFSMLVHNLIPHHHHANCITESHKVDCVHDEEGNHHHHNQTTKNHCDHNYLFHNHNQEDENHCHVSDIFKIEKYNLDICCSETQTFKYFDEGSDLAFYQGNDLYVETESQLIIFLRGPPIG